MTHEQKPESAEFRAREARPAVNMLFQQVNADQELAVVLQHFPDDVIDHDLVVLVEQEVDLLRCKMALPELLQYTWLNLSPEVVPKQSKERIRAGWKGLHYGGSLKKRKRKK